MKPLLLATISTLLACITTLACANRQESKPDPNTQTTAIEATAPRAAPVPPPQTDPNIKRILSTMDRASTWGHPDLFGEFGGMRRLFEGKYKGALKFFKIGAYYGDKLSQLSVGMMYLHGRGVSKDPATACAWITLAAERGYPSYVNARDQICSLLSGAQRDQAMAVLDTLWPEYGDTIAKQRMKLQLRIARNALTGSHLGFDFGVRTVALGSSAVNCGGYTLDLGSVEVPPEGCGRYDPNLWNTKKYFAARDSQWFGIVTVGPLTIVNPPFAGAIENNSDEGQ